MKLQFVCFLACICLFSCAFQKNAGDGSKYGKFLEKEVLPEAVKPCFAGAYYRKLVSSTDVWRGIKGKVVLPQIKFDEGRRNPKKPEQFLDNPSVYLGGSMNGQETDIGLTWEVVKDKNGGVSKERKAFRPFLRRTEYLPSGQKSAFENAPANANYYWYPGDTVSLSVRIIAKGRLLLEIEGAGKRFEQEFACDAYDVKGLAEFKRVNAIDQVGNEGFPVQATKTQVLNAHWLYTNLYRQVNAKLIEVPFHKGRYTEMACPDARYFQLISSDKDKREGAELINISGSDWP